MKQLFASISILSVLAFQFSDLPVYVSFIINRDYIAKNLCVERDIEGSTCKGCCQLKKDLAKQAEQKKQVPTARNEKQNIDLFTQNTLKIALYRPNSEIQKNNSANHYFSSFLSRIFHPPQSR